MSQVIVLDGQTYEIVSVNQRFAILRLPMSAESFVLDLETGIVYKPEIRGSLVCAVVHGHA